MSQRGISRQWEATCLVLIMLLAVVLRFHRLPEVPAGLHFDEGFKGVTSRSLLEGAPLKLFFESDMGEEPIAMYLVTAALGLAGQEPWVVRLPSAIVGSLTVALAWWLGRELFALSRPRKDQEPQPTVLYSQLMGLGTALILAILYWHLTFSRIGMEPILVPFFITLTFAALARGLNTGAWWAFALSGAALGGCLYTYKAGYFVPILMVVFVAYAAIVERGFLRRHRRGLVIVALVALLVAAPIALYFVTHPDNFLQRPTSVALVGGERAPDGPLQALSQNLPKVLGMFVIRGDENPRSNLPGRPALDPFLALLFLIGAVRSLVGFRRPLSILPLLWLAVMTVPTLITEFAPHFGRAIGATPALAILCALGGVTLWQGAAKLGKRWLQVGVALLLAVGLMSSGLSTASHYFQVWASSPDQFYAYDVGLVEVAGYMNDQPESHDLYLTPTSHEHFTLQFVAQRPFLTFDGRAGWVFPPTGREATVIVLLREDQTTLPAMQDQRPDGEVVWTLDDGYGHPYAAAYHLPASSQPAPMPEHASDVVFGDAARLLGYSVGEALPTAGTTTNLYLYWQVLAPFEYDYTAFTHLLGEHNPATNGPLWAGHDGQPVGGHYPTTAWLPGQVIVDIHPLAVPAEIPPDTYHLEVGLYRLETMTRLRAVDSSGQAVPNDAALLGEIEVGE